MSFVPDGIENVRALVLPDGIAADGTYAAVSQAALITWHSHHAGMLYQVYVNGQYAGTTVDVKQRKLVVPVPSSPQSAVRVEVVAVEPKDAHVDFARLIEPPPAGSGRVRLVLLRSQILSIEATANIHFDDGTGQINYAKPLNASPIPIWPCWQDKAGFGMAQFGTGDFGYDSAAAVGFGMGSFGHGQFGLDADTIEWISPPLPLGRYRFGIKILNAQGNESLPSETESIAVIPAAKPAVALRIVAFDPQTGRLTLNISDQMLTQGDNDG
jgi:hypothetical protein